jgi:hypothetical protein
MLWYNRPNGVFSAGLNQIIAKKNLFWKQFGSLSVRCSFLLVL